MVEVQKLEVFCVFAARGRTLCGDDVLSLWRRTNSSLSRRTLCGDRACQALSLWRCAILLLAKWPLEVVSWFARLLSQSRGRGFDSPLFRGSSSWKIATFKYMEVVGEVHFRSWKIVTFKYESSVQSKLLRLENRNF